MAWASHVSWKGVKKRRLLFWNIILLLYFIVSLAENVTSPDKVTERNQSEHVDICISAMDDSPGTNISGIQFVAKIEHPFLQANKGLVPGLEYKVSLSTVSPSPIGPLMLTSDPYGIFRSTSLGKICNGSSSIVIHHLEEVEFSVTFIPSRYAEGSRGSNLIIAIPMGKETGWVKIWTHPYTTRNDCFHVRNKTEGRIISKDLTIMNERCKEISLLLTFPKWSYMELQLRDVHIEGGANPGWISIRNFSEESAGLSIHRNIGDITCLAKTGFLLITLVQCKLCEFEADFTAIAATFECNSTVTMHRGIIERWSMTSLAHEGKSCYTVLEAPPHHRVLVQFSQDRKQLLQHKNCEEFSFSLDPVSGYNQPAVWSSCGNNSTQHSVFLSQRNFLTLVWNEKITSLNIDKQRTFTLNYSFLLPCENHFFDKSESGSLCSPGYPQVLLACEMSYSIYVPLGYTVELSFSQLELSQDEKSAFCNHNYLEITTRNREDEQNGGDKTLARLCGNWTTVDTDLLTFRSSTNFLRLRVSGVSKDSHVRGFCASFRAVPNNDNLTNSCDYGWVSSDKFCYAIFGQERNWTLAETFCREQGGHLVSVTNVGISNLLDEMIKTGPLYDKKRAFWIGANDLMYENCYEWTDGQPFNFENWFPGWEHYGGYSAQPSDDGLSHQNCVEMRNVFRYPSKGEGITDVFYWNDRDCEVTNPFICQKLKPGINLEQVPIPTCNRSFILTADHQRDVITSPNFPDHYLNNLECHYNISAPANYKIVLIFTDFHLEEGDKCEYDYLKIEDLGEIGKQWLRCGDWQRKIKLLRHISETNRLHITFVSDFSHSYSGFRIELRLLSDKPTSSVLCDNEMFELKEGHCYLMVSYPETSWVTAKQICSEARAQLATVDSSKELSILHDMIRVTYGYMSGILFWMGASTQPGSFTWRWIDGRPLNPKKFHILRNEDPQASCLAIQWRQLRSNSALYWAAKNCNHPGRFICKKKAIVIPKGLNRTLTVSTGNLTSVNYPSNYVNDLEYTIKIQGPPRSKVVVTFHHLDLEWQEECLYDYVLLRNDLTEEGTRFCGDLDRAKERFEFDSTSNTLYFTFHSDYSITATGYFASYEMIEFTSCANRHVIVPSVIHVTSLRYPKGYLSGMDCRTTLESKDPNRRLLFTLIDVDIVSDGKCYDDYIEIFLEPPPASKKVKFCDSDVLPGTQLMAYGHEALLSFHTEPRERENTKKRGFNITVEAWDASQLQTNLFLKGVGSIYSLNFPQPAPDSLNYSQRLVVPIGHKIYLRPPNITYWSSRPATACYASGLSLWDPYGGVGNRTLWNPCLNPNSLVLNDGTWSTLHVLYVNSWSTDGSLPRYYIDYKVTKDDHFVNTTLSVSSTSQSVDSCLPNPCQHGGRCHFNGVISQCHCYGHYTGLFCHLTWCDLNVCGDYGMCNLTSNGYHCECLNGFTGEKCQQVMTPCLPNPCEPNGECTVENGTFACFCNIWYEGLRCEKYAYRIPYKPLSQRMLEEPFWLGLITVFTVLLIILFVYCIKRKFADKIEKFLAEEIERSKFQPSPPATRYSLSSNQPSLTPGSQSPQTNPKSLFNRIRKNSLLSSSCSPNATPEKEHSRTFSFDDILRRVHSSKRRPNNTRGASNNGLSGASCSASGDTGNFKQESTMKEEEKSRILASLVTSSKDPESRRMSLDEFFRLNERKMKFSSRKEGTSDSLASESITRETSFIDILSPKVNRFSAPSFAEIQSIREQSMEYVSSSDSLNGEPNTSEVQADVLPNPTFYVTEYQDQDQELLSDAGHSSSVENSPTRSPSPKSRSPSPSEMQPKSLTPPPTVSIAVDCCEREESDPEEKINEETISENTCDKRQTVSPVPKRQSSYLEVPHPIPSIQVFSADPDSPEVETPNVKTLSAPKIDRSAQSSPCKMEYVQPRKYSVDLPMPKILITTNMNSCDSDEASPPRTPNPVKSMMYLSPLAVISSSADRTISESNLSTSGYSSISSPGLSRCNSSSPISDDVDQQQQPQQQQHHHHQNCSRKSECQSPKKPVSHGLQMTQMTYLTVGAGDKTFYFPPTIACHCQEVTTNPPPVVLNTKTALTPTAWRCPASRQGQEKNRLLAKRNSYQTTSTDDSIDDEGIGMDTMDFKIRKGEVRSARDLEMYIAAEKQDQEEPNTYTDFPAINPDKLLSAPSITLESNKPDLLACSVNKSGAPNTFKGSPRSNNRKNEKAKKYIEKHRRSPIMSPASTPVKDLLESSDSRIPRNSSRTSMSGLIVSSSESDDPEGLVGSRPKSQARRPKKPHESFGNTNTGNKQSFPSSPSSTSQPPEHTRVAERSSDATSRSESNGDSAPMDSRSPASSSSESLPSTRDSTLSNKGSSTDQRMSPPTKMVPSPLCSKHRLALEHASSYPPPKQMHQQHYHSHHNIRHNCKDDAKPPSLKSSENVSPIAEDFAQSSLQRQSSAESSNGKRVLHPLASRLGSGAAFTRPIPQSLDSIESSVPSDSEEEVTHANNRYKDRFFRPLLRLPEEGLHPPLKRQEAIAEDDISDDSSSETTVLLRRPPTDGSTSERSSPCLPHKGNSSSQSAEISEWETASLFQADSPRSPGEQKKAGDKDTTEK